MKPPRAPKGLEATGRATFRSVLAIYVLDPGELVLLAQLCRTLDRIDAIEDALAREGLTVAGSRGQRRAHPLLSALSTAQATASRLVGELALPPMPVQASQPRASVTRPKLAFA
jgi:phage terminase small subunit